MDTIKKIIVKPSYKIIVKASHKMDIIKFFPCIASLKEENPLGLLMLKAPPRNLRFRIMVDFLEMSHSIIWLESHIIFPPNNIHLDIAEMPILFLMCCYKISTNYESLDQNRENFPLIFFMNI